MTGTSLALLFLCTAIAHGAEPDPLLTVDHRFTAQTPGWTDLISGFANSPDITADFTERRFFPFKKEPVELKGVVRVSHTHGLSLHYAVPEARTVILDEQGVVVRGPDGEKAPPPDPRTTAANEALLHLLRFDFPALEKDFELYGERSVQAWKLALVPKTDALRRSVGRITASGEAATIRHIEIRRTPRQAVEIIIEVPHPPAAFSTEEVQRYFRQPS